MNNEPWTQEEIDFWNEFTDAWYYLPKPEHIPESLSRNRCRIVRDELIEMKEDIEKAIQLLNNRIDVLKENE